MSVDVVAFTDRRDYAADVLAIFHDRVAYREVAQRDLVTDGHVMVGYGAQLAVILCDDAQQLGACLEAFDDDDPDIVPMIVYQQMRCGSHASEAEGYRDVFYKIYKITG
jgi:hypothetical protein